MLVEELGTSQSGGSDLQCLLWGEQWCSGSLANLPGATQMLPAFGKVV